MSALRQPAVRTRAVGGGKVRENHATRDARRTRSDPRAAVGPLCTYSDFGVDTVLPLDHFHLPCYLMGACLATLRTSPCVDAVMFLGPSTLERN